MNKYLKILIKILAVFLLIVLIIWIDKEFFMQRRVMGHNWKWNSGYSCGDFMFKNQYYLEKDTIIINNGNKALIKYQIFDRLIISDISNTSYGEYVRK